MIFKRLSRILIRYKWLLTSAAALGLCIAMLATWAYRTVSASVEHAVYTNPATCPANNIGILFGCGKYVTGGRRNLYYLYRIRAAAALYKAGAIKHILVSGDNHTVSYNEPETMKQDLIKEGIPATAITLDYAGFSTFETLMRAKAVFGVQQATLITQPFHLPRALYVAEKQGINAIGYAAREPYRSVQTQKTELREIVARIVTYDDLNIWRRQPKFLGKKEYIVVK